MEKKEFMGFLAISLLIGLGIYLSFPRTTTSDRITLSGEGIVLDLLMENHEVITEETQWGPYIKCIDGICGDSNSFWLFYVNGELASVGAHIYEAQDGDEIVFEFTSSYPSGEEYENQE